jgi:3-hydroxyisobutyrate dehydrogenase
LRSVSLMAAVAVLGIGAMGSRIASGLLGAGHQVTIWNRTPRIYEALAARGVAAAATPAQAVQRAEFVIACVRDDQASRSVWLDSLHGALQAMPSEAIAIECSTLTVAWIRELSALASAANKRLIDAPFAGSRPQADNRQLIFFAAGNNDALGAATPILRALGQVHTVGQTGCGAALKLSVNALFATQIAQFAELLAVLENSGVERDLAVEVIGQTPVVSPALRAAAAAMLSGNFAPMFPIELVAKDLNCALASAKATGCATPITAVASSVFGNALGAGFATDNITGVVQLYPSRGARPID